MAKDVVFNVARPTYESIVNHHNLAIAALAGYFSEDNTAFVGYSVPELSSLREHEQAAQAQQDVLALLAFLEAVFRVDYISRKRLNLKDGLSKALIRVFNRKRYKATLTEDIVKTWLRADAITHTENSHIHESFQLRHWLAHGQYWTRENVPKRDFYDIAALVEGLVNAKVFKVAPP
jgi:hypothetical protein